MGVAFKHERRRRATHRPTATAALHEALHTHCPTRNAAVQNARSKVHTLHKSATPKVDLDTKQCKSQRMDTGQLTTSINPNFVLLMYCCFEGDVIFKVAFVQISKHCSAPPRPSLADLGQRSARLLQVLTDNEHNRRRRRPRPQRCHMAPWHVHAENHVCRKSCTLGPVQLDSTEHTQDESDKKAPVAYGGCREACPEQRLG